MKKSPQLGTRILLQMELEFSSESVNYREERRKTRWQSDDASIRLSKR